MARGERDQLHAPAGEERVGGDKRASGRSKTHHCTSRWTNHKGNGRAIQPRSRRLDARQRSVGAPGQDRSPSGPVVRSKRVGGEDSLPSQGARDVPLRYPLLLGTFTFLFVLRVAGQVLVGLGEASLLPPFERWYSGLLPYWLLLPAQIALIVLMLKIVTISPAAMVTSSTSTRAPASSCR